MQLNEKHQQRLVAQSQYLRQYSMDRLEEAQKMYDNLDFVSKKLINGFTRSIELFWNSQLQLDDECIERITAEQAVIGLFQFHNRTMAKISKSFKELQSNMTEFLEKHDDEKELRLQFELLSDDLTELDLHKVHDFIVEAHQSQSQRSYSSLLKISEAFKDLKSVMDEFLERNDDEKELRLKFELLSDDITELDLMILNGAFGDSSENQKYASSSKAHLDTTLLLLDEMKSIEHSLNSSYAVANPPMDTEMLDILPFKTADLDYLKPSQSSAITAIYQRIKLGIQATATLIPVLNNLFNGSSVTKSPSLMSFNQSREVLHEPDENNQHTKSMVNYILTLRRKLIEQEKYANGIFCH
jgi:hypothetical protein